MSSTLVATSPTTTGFVDTWKQWTTITVTTGYLGFLIYYFAYLSKNLGTVVSVPANATITSSTAALGNITTN